MAGASDGDGSAPWERRPVLIADSPAGERGASLELVRLDEVNQGRDVAFELVYGGTTLVSGVLPSAERQLRSSVGGAVFDERIDDHAVVLRVRNEDSGDGAATDADSATMAGAVALVATLHRPARRITCAEAAAERSYPALRPRSRTGSGEIDPLLAGTTEVHLGTAAPPTRPAATVAPRPDDAPQPSTSAVTVAVYRSADALLRRRIARISGRNRRGGQPPRQSP